MRLLIASSLCFCLVIAVPHRPGWRLKFEECYGTFECLQANAALNVRGAPYVELERSMLPSVSHHAVGTTKNFSETSLAMSKAPMLSAVIPTNVHTSMSVVRCAQPMLHAVPGTQFAPTCRRDCPPGDPNYRFFPEPVTLN
ncbi:unnamed protein product, partial [Mesorhabditis belari]|uniref:Uncharacterized protein n=1 Tax=Mesorhabditis belari TaxID=2138241 RepID=A0AAF3J268_9BILA